MANLLEDFKSRCREMKKRSCVRKSFQSGEIIGKNMEEICWHPKCHRKGVFIGTGVVLEKPFVTATVKCCSHCLKSKTMSKIDSDKPEEFLAEIKRLLLQDPSLSSFMEVEGICPNCGQSSHMYQKYGKRSRDDGVWTVCINPLCNWQGKCGTNMNIPKTELSEPIS